MLFGTPIDERDPDHDYPLAGFRGGHGTMSGRGVLLATTLFDDAGTLGYLDLLTPRDVEPVTIEGLRHDGAGELEGLDHLERDRYSLVYNIDGCSWAYAGAFDEDGRTFTVERVLVGEDELAGGVLHGIEFDEGSGRFVVVVLHRHEPDAAARASGRGVGVRAAHARAGSGPGARAPVGR